MAGSAQPRATNAWARRQKTGQQPFFTGGQRFVSGDGIVHRQKFSCFRDLPKNSAELSICKRCEDADSAIATRCVAAIGTPAAKIVGAAPNLPLWSPVIRLHNGAVVDNRVYQ